MANGFSALVPTAGAVSTGIDSAGRVQVDATCIDCRSTIRTQRGVYNIHVSCLSDECPS
jgi:hypothetical protein